MDALIGDSGAKYNAGPQRQQPLSTHSQALHSAVWSNQPDCVKQLLENGANKDLQDGESGWTALHRAFYWGNYQCAAVLLAANAHLSLADCKGRTALDLLSEERKCFLEHQQAGVVYSWGNGANYQLGTGATGLQPGPVRLEALRKELVVQIAAAKFHSAAVTKDGRLFTWGFGRGGRLGHADFHVHSGESAIIVPKAVTGLGRRQVAVVAVAKHHTAVATTSCELFTWGSNRDGRLGYAAVDSQPTPRKVTSLKQRVVAVAAANKHTAVLTDAGSIYSWGSNDQGQLGYGTSDSASNAVPRQVEAMKGKRLIAVAAAKRHMVVMSSEGDIYTWGHRVVTPRRVQLAGARDVQRADGFTEIAFHKGQSEMSRPHAVAIAAGAAHSCCLTRTGVVLAWRSWDPNLSVQEVSSSLAGKQVISIAAGKYRTAAVTDEGDVYMWEGLSKQHPHRKKAPKDAALPPKPDKATSRRLSLSNVITPERVEGLKRVRKACVGEKHSLALHCWCPSPKQLRLPVLAAAAALPAADRLQSNADAEDFAELVAQAQEDAEWTAAADSSLGAAAVAGPAAGAAAPAESNAHADARQESAEGTEWLGRDFWVGLESAHQRIQAAQAQAEASECHQAEGLKADSLPSLQRLCERSLAESAVEPRTCLQIMEYADACGAEVLKQFCLGIALANLDCVLLEARGVLEGISPHLLAEVEDVQKAQFEAASPVLEGTSLILQRLLSRRPTAVAPHEGAEEGEQLDESGSGRRSSLAGQGLVPSLSNIASELAKERSFCNPEDTEEAAATGRQVRNLKKKLQQIEALEARQQDSQLDPQQQAKLGQKAEVCAILAALQSGASLEEAHKVAQSHRPCSAATLMPGGPVHRSPSVLSMDRASSRGKSGGGKHRSGASRLSSRQDLSQTPPAQAPGAGIIKASHTTPPANPQQSTPQHPPELECDTPNTLLDRPAPTCLPATQLSTASCTSQAESTAAGLSPPSAAAATASVSKASAWGQARTCPPAASLRVSGFSTPEKQKADAPAWANAVSGPSLSFGSAGSAGGINTPSSSSTAPAAAKKMKPPRRGGLSMFLSGELEKATPAAPPPPAPTTAADFSWGGARTSQSGPALTSLRDIQSQEAAVTLRPEVQRNSSQASSGPTPSLSSSRARPAKQEAKDRESHDQAVDQMFDRKRVPLEALVRRSSPIAVAAKEEAPAEPQGPAWGGAVLGASPPGPGADAGPQEAKPRLSDIQAEQERVRDSCSRSFGAAGSSPAAGDGFASLLHWRGGSGGTGAAAGSSPGGLFPAGSSPHTARKFYTPSPQQNSKWYIKEERPVVALQDIQTEEFTRDLQAQQEAAAAAAAKLQAEEDAVAAAAQKALKRKQRQQRQAKAKGAAQARQQQEASAQAASVTASQDHPTLQNCQPCAADDASFSDTAKLQSSGTVSQRGQVEPSPVPLQDGKPMAAGHSNPSRSSNQRQSQHARKQRGDNRHATRAGQPAVSHGKAPSGNVLQSPSSDARIAGSKPRILEVRRPMRHTSVKQLGLQDAASSANIAADQAGTEAMKPGRQQLHAPS